MKVMGERGKYNEKKEDKRGCRTIVTEEVALPLALGA
jgi:hypothetical protein